MTSNRDSAAIETERALLGAVLTAPALLGAVADHLTADDFARPGHRIVYRTLLQLADADRSLDLMTLRAELAQAAQLEAAGGVAYIAGLLDGVPVVAESAAVEWARRVARHGACRRMAESLRALAEQADSGDAAPDDLRAGVERLLDGAAPASPAVLDLAAVAASTWATLEAEIQGRAVGVSSGLPDLDRRLRAGGWRPGQLVAVGARTSRGKSALLLGFGEAAAAAGKSVLCVTLEMGAEELQARRLLAHSGVSLAGLHYWRADERERALDRLAESTPILSRALYFAAPHVRTLAQIRAAARRHKARHGLDVLVVDYLGLIHDPKARSLYERTTATSQGLKALAMDLNIPVLTAVQLNRQSAQPGKPERPSLSMFRDSGAVEQDADVALLIHQADSVDAIQDGAAEVLIAKQRNGWTGSVPVRWRAACARFESHDEGDE